MPRGNEVCKANMQRLMKISKKHPEPTICVYRCIHVHAGHYNTTVSKMTHTHTMKMKQ